MGNLRQFSFGILLSKISLYMNNHVGEVSLIVHSLCVYVFCPCDDGPKLCHKVPTKFDIMYADTFSNQTYQFFLLHVMYPYINEPTTATQPSKHLQPPL